MTSSSSKRSSLRHTHIVPSYVPQTPCKWSSLVPRLCNTTLEHPWMIELRAGSAQVSLGHSHLDIEYCTVRTYLTCLRICQCWDSAQLGHSSKVRLWAMAGEPAACTATCGHQPPARGRFLIACSHATTPRALGKREVFTSDGSKPWKVAVVPGC